MKTGFSLFSCNKANDTESIENVVSGKLKAVYSSSDNKKSSTTTYEYDGSNRLSKQTSIYIDSTQSVQVINAETFFYTGASEVPNKKTIARSRGVTDSSLYFHDSQNRLI